MIYRARDDVATVRERTFRALTVYVTQVPAAHRAHGLHLCLIVTRNLDIASDHTFDEILDSHSATDELRRPLALIVKPSWRSWRGPELGDIVEREYRLKP